jgi:hypothetical protein
MLQLESNLELFLDDQIIQFVGRVKLWDVSCEPTLTYYLVNTLARLDAFRHGAEAISVNKMSISVAGDNFSDECCTFATVSLLRNQGG